MRRTSIASLFIVFFLLVSSQAQTFEHPCQQPNCTGQWQEIFPPEPIDVSDISGFSPCSLNVHWAKRWCPNNRTFEVVMLSINNGSCSFVGWDSFSTWQQIGIKLMNKIASEANPTEFQCPNDAATIQLLEWACYGQCVYEVNGGVGGGSGYLISVDRRCSDVCCKKRMSFCYNGTTLQKTAITIESPLNSSCLETGICREPILPVQVTPLYVTPCTVSCPQE